MRMVTLTKTNGWVEQDDNAGGVGDQNHNLQHDDDSGGGLDKTMMVTKTMTMTKTMIINMKTFDQETGDQDITRL